MKCSGMKISHVKLFHDAEILFTQKNKKKVNFEYFKWAEK